MEELKSKAKAATPGPWYHEEGYPCVHTSLELSGKNLARTNEVDNSDKPTSLYNAIYIAAASPDVILKLIERLEDAERLLFCRAISMGTPAKNRWYQRKTYIKKWSVK